MENNILGLDLGTNSIGWSLINRDFSGNYKNVLGQGKIIGMGSRIIPMSQDMLDKFGKGQSISQTAERTRYRSVRRLRQRHLLRRERLHRVLNIIDALPEHYRNAIDFKEKKGQFIQDKEVKISYRINENGNHEFIFKESFLEMLNDFREKSPEYFYNKSLKLPYDWTIYYLRKKALREKISLQELTWIILNFNQKRGYYQLRGENEEEQNKSVEFHALKVINVTANEPNTKNEIWYNIELENGWVYKRKSEIPLNDWAGKIKEFIVTTQLNKDGTIKTDKKGKEQRSFKAVDSEKDWIAIKKSTEEKIEESRLYVGEYIYQTLLNNPAQKIRGKLIRTIERYFYKNELKAILERQKEFHDELKNTDLLNKCINELYPKNYAQQNVLKSQDFTYLIIEDIVFYQRPLKSKKSLIDECRFESRTYIDENGEKQTRPKRRTVH